MAGSVLYGEISIGTAIYDLADELVSLYQANMERQGVVASGTLKDAAPYYVFNWRGETLALTLRLPEHWYYVEHGRNPTSGATGKRWSDPVGDIVRWMQVKHIVPRVRQQARRRSTTRQQDPYRQAARAIVHKIHTRGFYDPNHHGQHPLEQAIEESDIRHRFVGALTDQFNRAVRVELNDQLVLNTNNN